MFLRFHSRVIIHHVVVMNLQKPIDDMPPSTHSAFLKLFGIGVLGWLVGTLILLGLSRPLGHVDSISNAVLWAISHSWISFGAGLLVLVGYGLIARLPVSVVAWAYVLPAALLAGISWLCLKTYPDAVFRGDLSTYLPLILLFYGFGYLWMSVRKDASETTSFTRAIVPSIVGGLVILGFVAVPVFTSDAFRYRDTFKFVISKTTLNDGSILSEGRIEIRKPGRYEFTAPRYSWAELALSDESEPGIDVGAITWGAAGPPNPDTLGVFPLQIFWRKGVLPAGTDELPPYENSVYLEVRNADEGNKLIYSLTAPMQTY